MEKKNKKILILGNSHLVVFGFRGELIEKLISEGYDVTVAFPNGPFGEGEKTSKEYGCKFVEMPMNRRGKNPIEEIRLLNRYIKLIKSINPAIVLAYTVKCDILENSTVRDYIDKFEKVLDSSDNIFKGESEEEDLSNLSDDTIWEKLKDRIYDSSVTIVFISPGMKENYEKDRNQWIPWEISYYAKWRQFPYINS